MSSAENKDVILRWYDAVNQGDIAVLDKLAEEVFTADFIEHDPRMPDFEPGPAGIKKFIRQVRSEYTGVHVTVHDILAEEDKAAYRFTLSMTNASNGEPVDVQLLAIARFAGGQIVEEWELGTRGRW
jgi:ketosteroid isomerase-like protein